jgi:4-hydroxy-tetrahydrodipicolinate synthase
MMAHNLTGVFCVACTAFGSDGALDEAAQRKHIRYVLDEGHVHAIIAAGSTGEFAALSDGERRQVVDVIMDEVGGSVPVWVGAAAVSTRDAVKHATYAEGAGAKGVMIVPPYYCHPTEREIYQHYRAIAASVSIPIMVYNNPWTSGVDMSPALIASLGEIDNVSCVKESSGDMRRVSEILRLSDGKMQVYCGADNLALEMFAIGIRGWVCASSNAIPAQCVRLFKLVAEEGDLASAWPLYFRMLPYFSALEAGQFVQFVKASLDILGRGIGNPRPPLLPARTEDRAMLKDLLVGLGT